MADKEVYIIEIDVDGKAAVKAMDDIEKKADKTGKSLKSDLGGGFDGVGAALGKLKGAFLGIAAAIGAGQLFSKAIEGAIEQEKAVNRLNVALKLSGNYTEQASKDLQDYANSLQQVTTVGDETSLEMLSLALTFTKTTDQAKALYAAALDLSAATGTDLNTAVEQLGKTLTGSAGRLAVYETKLQSLSKEQLRAGAGIDLIAAKFKGAALANAQTFSGAMVILNNNFGEILESIGNFIVKSPQLSSVLKGNAEAFATIASNIDAARIRAFGDDNEKAAQKLADLKSQLELARTKLWQYKEQLMVASEESGVFAWLQERAAKGAVAEQTKAVAQLTSQYAELEKQLVSTSTTADKGGGGGTVIDLAAVKLAREEFAKTVQQIKDQRLALQVSGAQAITDETERAASLEQLKAQRIESINAAFTERLTAIKKLADEKQYITAQQYNEAIIEATKLRNEQLIALDNDAQKAQLAKQEEFSKAIGATLVSGISSSFQALGAALAKGEDAWGAFAKGVLGIIGDLMIQVGTSIILQAEAIKDLQAAIAEFAWPAALAAGLALIALGGAFKAIGGGGGSSVPSASPTGGTTGPIATTPIAGDQVAAPGQTQAININVEGTVLDPRGVGQQIAAILQETFESNAATVRYA